MAYSAGFDIVINATSLFREMSRALRSLTVFDTTSYEIALETYVKTHVVNGTYLTVRYNYAETLTLAG